MICANCNRYITICDCDVETFPDIHYIHDEDGEMYCPEMYTGVATPSDKEILPNALEIILQP